MAPTVSIALKWVGNSPKGNLFRLELDSESAALHGPDGALIGKWSVFEARTCFAVPGVFSDAQRFKITMANGAIEFKTRRGDRRIIRRFLDSALSQLDETALEAMRIIGKRKIWGGVALLLIAGVAVAVGVSQASGTFSVHIVTALALTGVLTLFRGLDQLRSCGAARRIKISEE